MDRYFYKTMKLFLPATAATLTTDAFTVPSTVPAGTYKLVVRVKDPAGYRPNINLPLVEKMPMDSYTIFSSVVVK